MSLRLTTKQARQLGIEAEVEPKSKSKYGNRKVKADGRVFDSVAEYERYCELKLMEQAGEIISLELQPEFELIPAHKDWYGKRVPARIYRADFSYIKVVDGNIDDKMTVEDVKGMRTEMYKIKIALLSLRYPNIWFIETKAGGAPKRRSKNKRRK